MAEVPYDQGFYSQHGERSLESARIVVPLVMKLATIRSVIDIGCGIGGWLRAFEENGVAAVRGLDGNYVNPSALYIAPESFTAVDLKRQVGQISREKRYDLAVCLEVAEHLDAGSGSQLVDTLTDLAPLILFSARSRVRAESATSTNDGLAIGESNSGDGILKCSTQLRR